MSRTSSFPVLSAFRSTSRSAPRTASRTAPRSAIGSRLVAPVQALADAGVRRRPRDVVAVLEPVRADPADPTISVPPGQELLHDAAARLARFLRPGELVAPTADGRLRLRLHHDDRGARPERLQEMAYHAIEVLDALEGGSPVRDLGVGWAPITRRQDAQEAFVHASRAAEESLLQRDLLPRQSGVHAPSRSARVRRSVTVRQVLLASIGAMAAMFAVLVGLDHVGWDISTPLYWVLVGALGLTALTIWAECSHAVDPPLPPAAPQDPEPRATAVIAAYLPNEAETILETLEVFLAQRYAGGLQVVLAYNTPYRLPVEEDLRRLEARHPDLVVLEVAESTSKAQNVNAALRVAEGEFVGIFDADHHPMPGAFERAWRWIADGVDVVQGHCVIRNAEESALAKLVAVEFEQIYAVSHPGRATLHGFGIFGGSNGYWRASVLEQIRLRGSFLTEDIEASMRVLGAGGRIVNDPGLISRELAPTTPKALWSQRMRWAQGWFQVSLRHLGPTLTSSDLTRRQRLGAAYLMGWRELYPWLALTAWPLLAFFAWRDGGLDLTSPRFALLTLFVTASGPLQTLAAWRLAVPEIRRHRGWFVMAALANLLVYTEAKNLVNRVAHLKELRGEHQWVVTPRRPQVMAAEETEVAA